MYDRHTFRMMKHDLVYAMLQKAYGLTKEAKLSFLRRLLYTAVINGHVDQQDVEYAIRFSCVFNYPMNAKERREALQWMNYHGDRYLNKLLSHEQQQELKLLYELCERVVEEGDLSALQRIAELV